MVVRWLVLSVIAVAGALGLSVNTAQAQGKASIKVTVLDPLGARVPNATVTLHNDKGVIIETKSNRLGEAMLDGIGGGRYWIGSVAPGFQLRTTVPMFVSDAARITVDVTLPIGPLETSVTVTASATELLPSQIGAPVTVVDTATLSALGKTDVLDALRLGPGVSLVQVGARGGASSMFIRGGNSNFNKMLIDGIPVNDIGGGIDLAQFAFVGVGRIEVLRVANSVAYGSDALAGVVSLTSPRGVTRSPELTISADGGNLRTGRESASLAGAYRRFDYYNEFANLDTDNDLPNNKYRNKTYAGRFGLAAGHNTDVTATVRWSDRRFETPNSMSLFGTPDDAFQKDRQRFIGFGAQSQLSARWSGALRFASSDQRSRVENPTLSGEDVLGFGIGFGDTVTITGANGFAATGRGILDFGPYTFQSRSARQGVYAQTTYQVDPNVSISGGGNYEHEQGFSNPDAAPDTLRNNKAAWVEGRANLAHRISASAGLSYAHNETFKSAYSPRVSVTAFLRAPVAAEFWGDTRLTLNVGKGLKAASVGQVSSSLYKLLVATDTGAALAQSAGIGPILPERSRNFDVGIEQGMWRGRIRARLAYFDNEFFDLVEFVSKATLPQFGIAPEVAAATAFGAYVNSQSFRARGGEMSADAVVARFRIAGSYTYLDANVTKSLTGSSITPQFNPLFPGIPIGGFAPLVGERPFRRPANTGSLMVSYTQGRATIALTGYFAGKADDSTFLQGSDTSFGNSLLLPNHDLNFGYQKMDLSGSYRLNSRLKWYVTVENLLNQRYEPAFGFPALPASVRSGFTVVAGGGR